MPSPWRPERTLASRAATLAVQWPFPGPPVASSDAVPCISTRSGIPALSTAGMAPTATAASPRSAAEAIRPRGPPDPLEVPPSRRAAIPPNSCGPANSKRRRGLAVLRLGGHAPRRPVVSTSTYVAFSSQEKMPAGRRAFGLLPSQLGSRSDGEGLGGVAAMDPLLESSRT